jgi:hypothetical protein
VPNLSHPDSKLAALCPHFDHCSAGFCPALGGRHLKGEPVCVWLREAVKTGSAAALNDRIPSVLAETVLREADRIMDTACGLRWELQRAARHGSQRAQAERLNRRGTRHDSAGLLAQKARRVRS